MRHRNAGRQFGRNSSHRKALFRNLITSLLEHGRIETTEAKAKEIRGIADRMVTLGKRGDLNSKRIALSYIQSRDVVARLFDTIGPASASRNGGYTRVIKTRVRLGDSAPMAVIELVDRVVAAPEPKAEGKKEEAAPAPEKAGAKAVKKPKAAPKKPTKAAPKKKAESGAEAAEKKPKKKAPKKEE